MQGDHNRQHQCQKRCAAGEFHVRVWADATAAVGTISLARISIRSVSLDTLEQVAKAAIEAERDPRAAIEAYRQAVVSATQQGAA
jgi:hypothetical protein